MNEKALLRGLAVAGAIALISSASFAAKTPAKKATKAASTNKATKGTTQLKSDYNNPKFGEIFTLGKTNPINITVNSVEYTVDQVAIGSEEYVPKADEKLMVINYTLHNPNKSDYGLSWNALKFICVDANDKNWDYVQQTGMKATGERCQMSLKPAQKTQLFTIIRVPAKGVLPKLMIESRDRLVLRYNLQLTENRVKPLSAPFADPADTTGSTALDVVPAEIGVAYPHRCYDVKVDSIAFSDAVIKGKAPRAGHTYLVSIMTVKNSCPGKKDVKWNSFRPLLIDADGGEIRWNCELLYGSRDEDVYTAVEPGKEIRIRHYFEVPTGLALKELVLCEGTDYRKYSYDLTNLNQ